MLSDNLSFDKPDDVISALCADGRVRLQQGDILDLPALSAACAGLDGVFALAGFMSAGIAKNPCASSQKSLCPFPF